MSTFEEIIQTTEESQEALRKKSAADLENTVKAMLDNELTELRRRIEDLENKTTSSIPIPQLTPNDDLADTKQAVNFLINYLNIGIKNQ